MKTQINIRCPSCLSDNVKRNEMKSYAKQIYRYKDCHRQFVPDSQVSYRGCQSHIEDKIRLMFVRGDSITDIIVIKKVSKYKVLSD